MRIGFPENRIFTVECSLCGIHKKVPVFLLLTDNFRQGSSAPSPTKQNNHGTLMVRGLLLLSVIFFAHSEPGGIVNWCHQVSAQRRVVYSRLAGSVFLSCLAEKETHDEMMKMMVMMMMMMESWLHRQGPALFFFFLFPSQPAPSSNWWVTLVVFRPYTQLDGDYYYIKTGLHSTKAVIHIVYISNNNAEIQIRLDGKEKKNKNFFLHTHNLSPR